MSAGHVDKQGIFLQGATEISLQRSVNVALAGGDDLQPMCQRRLMRGSAHPADDEDLAIGDAGEHVGVAVVWPVAVVVMRFGAHLLRHDLALVHIRHFVVGRFAKVRADGVAVFGRKGYLHFNPP